MKKFYLVKRVVSLAVALLVIMSLFAYPLQAKNVFEDSFGYTYLNVTDYNYTAKEYLELNTINEGLRQRINDTVQNYSGCTVTFEVSYTQFSGELFYDKEQCALLGNSYFKQTVDITGNQITFDWDSFIPKHNMWGMLNNITLYSNTSFTIERVFIYVPKQSDILPELSAGAPCYEVAQKLVE